jgi:hypothetical protein
MVSNTLPRQRSRAQGSQDLNAPLSDGLAGGDTIVNTREDWAKALADEFQHAPRQTLRSSGCDRVEMHYWGWPHLAGIALTPGRNGGKQADGVQHASRSERHGRQPKQSANASLPMVFTLVGMAIDGRSRFAKKAESPMDSSTPLRK